MTIADKAVVVHRGLLRYWAGVEDALTRGAKRV
jgi:hypothetical protein